jgi:serine protease AprX
VARAGGVRRARTGIVVGVAAALAAAAGGAGTSWTVADAVPGDSGPVARYVVRAEPGHLDPLLGQLRSQHPSDLTTLAPLDTVVVALPASAAAALRNDPDVADVTPDSSVQLLGSQYDGTGPVEPMSTIAHLLNADKAWDAGATGAGVDVALVDSGVAPVAGLDGAGQVVDGPDFSSEGGQPNLRGLDTFGHGTFMAGLIAGHDRPDATGSTAAYEGIAPDARLVSVKVADAYGRTSVSQVIAGIDWVVDHAHSDGLDIRVLNLSFGTGSVQSYLLDPLAYAAEVAWHAGIVVVVSSGNDGGSTLTDPAADPFLLAVGALDTGATDRAVDDRVAPFTTIGNADRRIDLLAPGVHVQGLRVPGSYVDVRYGDTGRIDGRFFRGSGTSQAAALTSGVVALVLQERPDLTPDQVKYLLTNTDHTHPWLLGPDGAGVPDAFHAAFTGQPGNALPQRYERSTGSGSANGGRSGSGSANVPSPGGASWAGASWAADAWDGATWDGASWAGASWDGASWDGASWDGASWDGASWDGASWDGASWDGASWDSTGWLGQSWR